MNMTWTWPGPCPISNFPLVFLSYSTCVFTIVLSVKLTVTQRWHESWRRRWRGGARHQVLWEPLKSDYTLCLKSPRTTDQTSLCLKSTRRQTRHYSRLSYCVSVCVCGSVCVWAWVRVWSSGQDMLTFSREYVEPTERRGNGRRKRERKVGGVGTENYRCPWVPEMRRKWVKQTENGVKALR